MLKINSSIRVLLPCRMIVLHGAFWFKHSLLYSRSSRFFRELFCRELLWVCSWAKIIFQDQWGCHSLYDWIESLTLSQLLKLHPRKLEPWFFLWNFFSQKISVSLYIYHHFRWSIFVMFGLVLLSSTWKCYICYNNGYVGM